MAQAGSSTEKDDMSSDMTPGPALALYGIKMLLNNKPQEAQNLFAKHKDTSVQMSVGYCYVAFMNAFMTFEDEKVTWCLQILRETEQHCGYELGTLHSVRKLVFGSDALTNLEQRLEQQIIVADCHVCSALLYFTYQDVTSYVKGGWTLRKAWKIYDRTYREIKNLYETQFRSVTAHPVRPSSAVSVTNSHANDDDDGSQESHEEWLSHAEGVTRSSSASDLSTDNLPPEVISRLMTAVSFGYGLLQLCTSFLPPNLIKVIQFLGMEGSRSTGLDCLGFATQGQDMRTPLAVIALLWYHTMVRPFFALDGSNVLAGVPAAEYLLQETRKEYDKPALFLFFQARVERLKGQPDVAMKTYKIATEISPQREVHLVCLHDIAWCLLIKLAWEEAEKLFERLKNESRYAKPFYTYARSVCQGARGHTTESRATISEIPPLVMKRKHNQLEAFLLRRAQFHTREGVTQEAMLIYAFELLYLWNTIASCPAAIRESILSEIDKVTTARLMPMKFLVEGAILMEKKMKSGAQKCFEESIARGHAFKDESHAPAFATYELGMLLIQDPATFAQGKTYIHLAKDNYKTCDFENRLSFRVHAALRKYEQGLN